MAQYKYFKIKNSVISFDAVSRYKFDDQHMCLEFDLSGVAKIGFNYDNREEYLKERERINSYFNTPLVEEGEKE